MSDIQKLKESGIDIEEGLACCADDEEFYEEMLGEYVSEYRSGLEELNRFYEEKDWKNYGIRAHIVKSTSRMIGARSFSETAREMESAVRDGNQEQIIARHSDFIIGYQQLVDGIRKALG